MDGGDDVDVQMPRIVVKLVEAWAEARGGEMHPPAEHVGPIRVTSIFLGEDLVHLHCMLANASSTVL